jgi:hypothetical protein
MSIWLLLVVGFVGAVVGSGGTWLFNKLRSGGGPGEERGPKLGKPGGKPKSGRGASTQGDGGPGEER